LQVTTKLWKLADGTTIQHTESNNYVFGIAAYENNNQVSHKHIVSSH
jgi:beta-N-acetylglucosaminidase